MRIVSSRLLAEWLNFDAHTLRQWTKQKKLDEHLVKGILHHSEASIDALLALATKDGPTLTVADFRSGARLLTGRQAADILGIKTCSFYSRIHRGRFEGLQIGTQWRFLAETVWAHRAKHEGYLMGKDVMHIFGCSTRVIDRWRKAHILVPIRAEGGGRWRYFYHPDDVARVVTLCLPNHTKHLAEQWLDDMRTSQTPPLTSIAAMEYLGLSYADLKALRKKGGVFYLTLIGDRQEEARFTIPGLQRALAAQKAWTPHEIDHVIGGGARKISKWLDGPLACELHDHRGLDHRLACLVHVITPLLSPGLKARVWLTRRKDHQSPLVPDYAAAEYYGVSVANLALLAERGAFGGLRRPDGVWMFTTSRLEHTSHIKMAQLMLNLH